MVAGEKIGRYTLLGKLAQGGMAEVFLAKQEGPEGFAKTVVIKRILPTLSADEHFVKMFLNEARLAALLNHPHVVSIYELGRDEASGAYYMAMEWIDGCNLKRMVQVSAKRGQLPPLSVTARIIADACAGLDFAHNLKGTDGRPLNLIHRDISPENILITYDGVVKVVDFGIAKITQGEGLTRTGQVKGKFAYMAPELLLDKAVDRRVDLWALGVTLYWMLCGSKPFSAQNEGQIIQKILNEEPPPLSQRTPGLAELFSIAQRALKKDPSERFESARAMRKSLEEFLSRNATAGTTELGDYVGDLFPESSDPDRALTRAILSGDLRVQATPSETDVSVHSQVSGSTSVFLGKPKSRKALIGGAAGLGALVAIAVVMLVRGPSKAEVPPPSPPASAAKTPEPLQPLLPVPAPVAAPAPPSPKSEAKSSPEPRKHRERPESAAKPAPVPAGPPGTLVLRVVPWADVYVDGEKLGTTPMDPVSLASGIHRVKLVNDELKASKVMTVVIESGKPALVKAKLE